MQVMSIIFIILEIKTENFKTQEDKSIHSINHQINDITCQINSGKHCTLFKRVQKAINILMLL